MWKYSLQANKKKVMKLILIFYSKFDKNVSIHGNPENYGRLFIYRF